MPKNLFRLLDAQPDYSVSIVSIGFVTCLAQLLLSTPDSYSSLSSVELVRRKCWRRYDKTRRNDEYKTENNDAAVAAKSPALSC